MHYTTKNLLLLAFLGAAKGDITFLCQYLCTDVKGFCCYILSIYYIQRNVVFLIALLPLLLILGEVCHLAKKKT